MNTLVVYDSSYGNTAKIADAIRDALMGYGSAISSSVGDVRNEDFKKINMIIISSPTQGGRPTKPITQFINKLPPEVISDTKLAVFDTRFEVSEQKLPLRILMKTIGYAATKMAKSIQQRGGKLISQPQGFIVSDQEGPLKEGEIERAITWAARLALSSD